MDTNAVQRHRSTVVDCLKDPDVSIRRSAMALCFSLVNSQNLDLMATELLNFLGRSEPELKTVCASNLVSVVQRYIIYQWEIPSLVFNFNRI